MTAKWIEWDRNSTLQLKFKTYVKYVIGRFLFFLCSPYLLSLGIPDESFTSTYIQCCCILPQSILQYIHIYCTASVKLIRQVQTSDNLINKCDMWNWQLCVSCLPPRQDQTTARAWTQSAVWLRFSKPRRRRSQSMYCFLKGACPDAGSSSCR